jgi:hypothetical protein
LQRDCYSVQHGRCEISFKEPLFFYSRHSTDRLESSIDACEQRDRKGGYAKSGPGIIKEFSGISNSSEKPTDGYAVTGTVEFAPEEPAQEVNLGLGREGFIGLNDELT